MHVVQNRFFALDDLSPLPAAGLKDFALHTSHQTVHPL